MKNGKNNTFLLGIPARKPLCVRTNHEKKDDLTLMCSILSKGSGYPSYRTLYFDLFIFCHTIQHAGVLVPRPGIEPLPPAVEAWSPNHWITREVPLQDTLKHSWIQVTHHLPLCPTLDCKLVFRDHKKTLLLFTHVKEFRYAAVHLLQMLWCCLSQSSDPHILRGNLFFDASENHRELSEPWDPGLHRAGKSRFVPGGGA